VNDSKYTCAKCGEFIEKPGDLTFGDSHTYYEGEPLCLTCYFEDEPSATVYYRNEKEPHHISYTRNETDGDFWVEWKPSDAWRGRHTVYSKKFKKLFSDSILAYHESEAMLKELNDLVMGRFDEMNLDYARSFARTSNVFCTDFDIWTKNELIQVIKGLVVIESAKETVGFDNPLYSTGIIFDRESLDKIRELFKGEYALENDGDVMRLMQKKKEFFQEMIRRLYEDDIPEE